MSKSAASSEGTGLDKDFFGGALRQMYERLPPLPLEPDTLELFRWARPDLWSQVKDEDQNSHVPLIKHITKKRDEVLKEISYPCIAGYSFLVPGIRYQPCFKEVVKKMSSPVDSTDGYEPTFLDLGCGLAQDARALLAFADGHDIPSRRVVSSDLAAGLIDAGFALFGDQKNTGKLAEAKWEVADVFEEKDLQKLKALTHRGEGFDVIWLGSFVHLFSLESQRKVVQALDFLLSKRPGSIIFGRQTGSSQAHASQKEIQEASPVSSRSASPPAECTRPPHLVDNVFRHDASTFKEMFETGDVPSFTNVQSTGTPRDVTSSGSFGWTCSVQVTDWATTRAGKDPIRNLEAAQDGSLRRVLHETVLVPDTSSAEPGRFRTAQKEIKSLHFTVTRS